MRLPLLMAGVLMGMFVMTNVQGEDKMIEDGKTVSIQYVLTVDGEQVDASQEGQPLQYVQGQGQIIPGLESQLKSLNVGDKKDVVVGAEDAYGPINPEAIIEVPKDRVPGEIDPQVGMVLTMTAPNDQSTPAQIQEVKDDSLILNLNHPLAGKELHFNVEVVDVQ